MENKEVTMSRTITTRRLAAFAVLFLLAPTSGHAQEVASSFDQLRVLIRPGDRVGVTESGGRELDGVVDRLADSSLTLVVDGSKRTFQEDDVVRIRERTHDKLAAGARNGFIAGAALGVLAGLAVKGEVGSAAIVPFSAVLYGGLGAGVGAGIGAMIHGHRIIYDSSARRSPSLAIAPAIARERKGVAVLLAF
jgi:hypothetical protein